MTRSIRLSSADRAALNSSALDRPLGQQAQNARFLEEVNKANAAAIGALEAGDANCAVQPPFSADTIEAIMAASRKKDSAEVSRLLAQTVHAGRMEEQRGLLEATQRQRREHLRVTNQSVVCGFIAEVDAAQQAHRGLPKEMVFGINSFTVVKIVDALNAAGYHAKGFRDPVTR